MATLNIEVYEDADCVNDLVIELAKLLTTEDSNQEVKVSVTNGIDGANPRVVVSGPLYLLTMLANRIDDMEVGYGMVLKQVRWKK